MKKATCPQALHLPIRRGSCWDDAKCPSSGNKASDPETGPTAGLFGGICYKVLTLSDARFVTFPVTWAGPNPVQIIAPGCPATFAARILNCISCFL